MAMTFTAIANDPVLVEEGTFTMNYKASGAIKGGEAVCCSGATEAVRVCAKKCQYTWDAGYVGVALYPAAHNDMVAVAGPGNKVRVRVSGAVKAGMALCAYPKGFFRRALLARSSGANIQAIALQDITDGAYGKALLI